MNTQRHETADQTADAIVIGAGFGGLAAALTLGEQGKRVLLLEAMSYPGGCASSFQRAGITYEAGATLFSGLSDQGLFGKWRATHNLPIEFVFPDPAITIRTPSFSLPIYHERQRFIEMLCSLPNAPKDDVKRFFRDQQSQQN